MYENVIKRAFDFLAALMALVVLSPLLIIVTLLLAVNNRGQPFFLQERPGKKGHLFKIVKFKTMADLYDDQGQLLPDDQRLTRIGQVVRSLSIDELPQLVNVLKGDMSLVGPRPLLVKYLPLYTARQARRHEVRPGITGWAQVNGRNALSWEERFEYDVYYVENISFWLDAKIILLTIYKVFRREGISSGTSQTMEAFTGKSNHETQRPS